MKKKILLGLFIIIALFTITGCENSIVSNEFSINNVSFKFDQDATFGNFNYKKVEELEPDESRYAVYLDYENKDIYDGRFVFRISLAYSDETTLKDFLGGRSTTNKNINGIKWSTLSIDNTSDNKETTSIIYATEKNGTIYVVTTLIFKESNVNINKLAEVFMNGVTLK